MDKGLNPKLWQDKELLSEVKEKLFQIADNFINYLKEDEIDLKLKDLIIVGSNANYNYRDESDIDLHIIADMSDIEDEEEKRLLCILYNAYKSLFNKKFDIKIKGHEVEIYVEPDETITESGGVYSLIDGWLKFPEENIFTDPAEISDEFVDEFNKWEERYLELLKTFELEMRLNIDLETDNELAVVNEDINSSNKEAIERLSSFIEELYEFRKASLKQDGENSIGNKVFKAFRRLGYITTLRSLKTAFEEKEMSLESLTEEVEISEDELFWHLRDGLTDDKGEFINNTKYSVLAQNIISREILSLPKKEGNVRVEDGQIKYYPNPDNGFSVSGEQFNGHQLSKEKILEFNDKVDGEFVMYFYSNGPYGKEYSSYTMNEEKCKEACAGLLGDAFAQQETYAEFIGADKDPLFKDKNGNIVN